MNDSEQRKKERKGEKGGKEERTQMKKLEIFGVRVVERLGIGIREG